MITSIFVCLCNCWVVCFFTCLFICLQTHNLLHCLLTCLLPYLFVILVSCLPPYQLRVSLLTQGGLGVLFDNKAISAQLSWSWSWGWAWQNCNSLVNFQKFGNLFSRRDLILSRWHLLFIQSIHLKIKLHKWNHTHKCSSGS